jgi:putative glycosyltransferase
MKLSIVATLYQSALYISEFHQRATAVAKQFAGDDYEIVLVNDGSPDNSLDIAVKLIESDDHVVVVDLSRNFGHHKAMMTGLKYAIGEHVFLIDCDLEEEPEWLDLFWKKLSHSSCDVTFGIQAVRKGGWFERMTGQLYYSVFCALTGVTLPESVVTARLMTRRFVDALLQHDEREMFLGGLFSLAGFAQESVVVKKHSTSKTTYTFRLKVSLLVDTVTSFSNVPLMAIFYFGLFVSLASSGYIFYMVLNWLFFAAPPSGWTSVMASIWLLGGLIISFLGVIGIYLAKVFIETKRRPYTIARKIYGNNGQANNSTD